MVEVGAVYGVFVFDNGLDYSIRVVSVFIFGFGCRCTRTIHPMLADCCFLILQDRAFRFVRILKVYVLSTGYHNDCVLRKSQLRHSRRHVLCWFRVVLEPQSAQEPSFICPLVQQLQTIHVDPALYSQYG